jgi:hypothetical protein
MEKLLINNFRMTLVEGSIRTLKLTEYLRIQYKAIYESFICDTTAQGWEEYWKTSDPVTLTEYLHTMADELSDTSELYPFDHTAFIHFTAQFLMDESYYTKPS